MRWLLSGVQFVNADVSRFYFAVSRHPVHGRGAALPARPDLPRWGLAGLLSTDSIYKPLFNTLTEWDAHRSQVSLLLLI